MKKIGIITSRGGHLFQLMQLKPWWQKYHRFWVTFPGQDTHFFLEKEQIYYGYYPVSRHGLHAIFHFFLAIYILLREKPDLLISCGAGIAPPFFLVGKLLGIKLVFFEPYDFIQYPSLSGRILSRVVDRYLVQHKRQLPFSSRTLFWGSTL